MINHLKAYQYRSLVEDIVCSVGYLFKEKNSI